MNVVMEYLLYNYPTVLVVSAIIVIACENRNVRVEKAGQIVGMSFIPLVLSLLEFVEVWIRENNLDFHLLFYKAMLIYWLYPALTLCFLYLICDIKHKFLIAIPQIINMVFATMDLSGGGLVYTYREGYEYLSGFFIWIPFVVEDFYVLLIFVHSIRKLREKHKSKGVIVIFMLLTIALSQFFVMNGMSNMSVPTVVSIEILVYYSYLASIQYREIQEELHASLINLERSRTKFLLAQIKPHFFNSSLSVIRSLCYEDPDKAIEMIDNFSDYLREKFHLIADMELISFEKEMGFVENYLYLEEQRFPGRIEVIKEISVNDFSVPPLSIQTIVENAVRYGISMKEGKGTIWISTEKSGENIVIKVIDDGVGFEIEHTEIGGVDHVGIKNVQERFRDLLGGEVILESEIGKGTSVIIRIPGNAALSRGGSHLWDCGAVLK